jgi:hypothetical protein
MKHGAFIIIPKVTTSPRPKKVGMSKSQMNATLTTFAIKDIHFEFISQGQTVNKACHV